MANPIDTYLSSASESQLARAAEIRKLVHNKFPNEIEERLSYGMPGFRHTPSGKILLGFALNKNTIGVYPHSGGVLRNVKSNLVPYQTAKSALNFSLDTPIPAAIIKELLEVRLAEILA